MNCLIPTSLRWKRRILRVRVTLIGVVALVVLGPKRLPSVAQTAGVLFGRVQRYVDDVKAELAREIELDGLKKMRAGFETAALEVENKVHDLLRPQQSKLDNTGKSDTSMSDSVAGVEVSIYGDTSGVVTNISNA
jgi:sec-independent protein translocase protein TatB